jgi:hypothetical protein
MILDLTRILVVGIAFTILLYVTAIWGLLALINAPSQLLWLLAPLFLLAWVSFLKFAYWTFDGARHAGSEGA